MSKRTRDGLTVTNDVAADLPKGTWTTLDGAYRIVPVTDADGDRIGWRIEPEIAEIAKVAYEHVRFDDAHTALAIALTELEHLLAKQASKPAKRAAKKPAPRADKPASTAKGEPGMTPNRIAMLAVITAEPGIEIAVLSSRTGIALRYVERGTANLQKMGKINVNDDGSLHPVVETASASA